MSRYIEDGHRGPHGWWDELAAEVWTPLHDDDVERVFPFLPEDIKDMIIDQAAHPRLADEVY